MAAMPIQARVRPLPPPKYRIIVVLPADLGDKVRALAERERRPISTQIQVLIERAMAEDEPSAAA